MRRAEFQITEKADIQKILDQAEYGSLSYIDEAGFPAIRPLNFVTLEGKLYLHSALQGEKMQSLKQGGAVSFLVVEPLSIIPSYATDPELACNATQFFQSVIFQGVIKIIEDLSQKAEILEALMKKLQPEGGHRSINENKDAYQKALKAVALLEINPSKITAKFKLGQNLNATKLNYLIQTLQNSKDKKVEQTIALIQKYSPLNTLNKKKED